MTLSSSAIHSCGTPVQQVHITVRFSVITNCKLVRLLRQSFSNSAEPLIGVHNILWRGTYLLLAAFTALI